MPTLRKDLRSDLEKAVIKARDLAEQAAASALLAQAVDQPKPFPHMDNDARDLRNGLRERGRAAGDVRNEFSNAQTIGHLSQLVGYEHWHRMIFARFLAENGLLLEPEHQVALSLEDVQELAREEGRDLWELAGSYAQQMLPGVFRNDDAALKVTLAREDRAKLDKLLADLDSAAFTADDTLGWTYQFWQTKRKEAVNKSGVKIGADEISPVTQLFTEDYMVEFLLHNTLGAWWAGKLGPIAADSEEEARGKAALPPRNGLPGITWTYLRFMQDPETKRWSPAAGTFPGWPALAALITFLDPCMGSGHFPVFALPILARLRMEEESLSAKEAVCAVLRDNLHGLELDPRCTQIGAFNLALTAWKLAGYQILPPLHVACCGLAPRAKKDDWLKLAGDNDKLRRGMERLYDLFEQAPVLGSLINPRARDDGSLIEASFDELAPLLEKALADEKADDAAHEMAVTAQGLAKAAEILAGQFTLVATNVPYRGCNDLVPELKEFIESAYPRGRTDLATCLFERCIELCANDGTTAVVSPQAWLFIGPYRRLREHLLKSTHFSFVAQLGKHAFATIGGEVVNVNLTAISKSRASSESVFTSIDVSALLPLETKTAALLSEEVVRLGQLKQLENPDARIVTDTDRPTVLLRAFADSYKGIATGDMGRFIHCFWEHSPLGKVWSPLQGRVDVPAAFGGREQVVLWENGRGQLYKFVSERLGEDSVGAWLRGDQAWQHRGIAIGQMTSLPCTLYLGDQFDENTAAVIPKHEKDLPAMWAYCQSQEYRDEVKKLDNSSLKLPNLTLIKVPFDLEHWQKVAAEKYPDGLPKPHSDDPTQWLFHGHPNPEHPHAMLNRPKDASGHFISPPSFFTLHVAVARLLGYRWPRQTGSSFPDCPALGSESLEELADDDGIVCLTPLRGEAKAAERVRKLLDSAMPGWNERQLLSDAGSTKTNLEDWLRDEFFEQHAKLFHHRPFIWHIWDGRTDGFHALVNYHKLTAPDAAGHKLLENLTYAYLGDWIRRQRDDSAKGVPGAQDRLEAAEFLQQELKLILGGEPPYDIFIRWKPLHQQSIGWHPDLNDGVRLNIRPFLLARDVKKKGAGILRWQPNVKWTKDRGTEPQRNKGDFPWLWTWDEKIEDFKGGTKFDGNRWNDCHYTNKAKSEARERNEQKP
jgi:hypothetical protein